MTTRCSGSKKYRLDGLRFDSVINIRNRNGNNNDPANDLADGWSLLQWINDEIRGRQPWKITIAEDLQNNDWITAKRASAALASARNGTRHSSIRSATRSSPPTTPIAT